MEPFYFNGCFGWLHRNTEAPLPSLAPPSLGVVLCHPLGNEAICTHREWMELANMLAARGLAVLRFDYRDSGDSQNCDSSVSMWIESIVEAVACLKQQTGVKHVALCGLRLGASLAALAAERIGPEGGIAALAMLAPAISGRQLVREWRASAAASHLAAFDPPFADPSHALNVTGFIWPPSLLRDIEAIDLLQSKSVTPHLLLMTRHASRASKQLTSLWSEQGSAITEAPFPGYDALMNEPLTQATPHVAFGQVADWLAGIAQQALPVLTAPLPAVTIATTLRDDRLEETPLQFGRDKGLFGILGEPANQTDKKDIAVMMLHTGTSHHIGNGRILVDCARALAARGIGSLRMDVSGIGDSPLWPDDQENPLYGPHNLSDAISGLEALAAHGWKRVMVVGICAGAYLALQAALADTRVVSLMSMNLQSFRWIHGSSLEVAIRRNKRSLRSYLQSTRNIGAWKRVFRGEGDLPGIVAVMMQRGMAKLWRKMRDLRPPTPGSRIHRIRTQIQSLHERKLCGWFVWSDDDPGLESLHEYFGARGKHLKHLGMHVVIERHTDHNMNARRAREIFSRLMVDYAERSAP